MDSYTLKSVSDLPAPFRSTFSFRYFNSLQSECFPICFYSDINMVISAPTGSGKTVLFELCILRLLLRSISEEGKFIHTKGTLKTIYIAPSKALVQEKLRDWNQKFGSLGVNTLELTGDNEFYNIHNIQDADIIVTTPEKFDAVTRYRIKDGGLSFFSDIALLLIDEVHLLNDPRGAALEAIVSRIKILACNSEMKLSPLAQVRFIAVSATIPNIEDLAEWLKVPVQGIKRFGEEMRPVKLTTKVFGYTAAKNDFLFEKRLQNYIFDILMQYSRGKSALVFCSTRKGAQEAAQRISQIAMTYGHSNPFVRNKEQQHRLREASLSCSDKQMQSYILYGVGYHNGGLCLKDRNLIEGLFLKGDLQVLCATNTLAHGINLPAHTVVIKSTQHFNKEKGLYMEYDRSMVLQMCGRAGRPPFDSTGMVIIMTRRETVHLYENLLNGCELVESQLLSCLTEHLTAEIVQLTVSDITRAIEWMKCSYLYVRMKKNPANYSVRKGLSGDCIEKHIQEICVHKVNELTMNQMIWTDDDGFLLKPQEPGKLMTKYYLKFNTMKHIIQSPVNCNLEDALHIVCRAEELAWIQLRRNEKKLLNDINTDKDVRLRFHILDDKGKRKKRIQAKEEKMFVLANDCLTGDPLAHDLSLTQDTNSICSNGSRIAKCMKEYFIYKRNYKGARNSTLLAKSLHQKLWEDSPFLLKQLPGIGMVTAKALHSMGISSFETLAEADPRRIEMVAGRKYPFGNHIKESLNTLPPKVEMKIEEIESQRQGKSNLVVTLTRLSQSIQSTKRHYADMVVGSEENNLILFQEKIRVEEFDSPYSKTILLSNPIQGKLTIKADLIFEEHIGVDVHQTLSLVKEGNSNSDHQGRRSKQASSCHPLEKVPITEKDNGTSNTAPASKEHRHSNKNKRVLGPMPSFNLLDEEFEEVTEVEPAIEIEDDDCKIISEQTIFDHIRKKAKNFPVLNAPNNSGLSPSEALTLIRKRSHEKQPEPLDEFDFLQEAEANTFPRQPAINQHDTSMYPTDHKQDLGNGRLRSVINLENDRENPVKALTEETVFDHIRRKSRNYPVINKSKMAEPELLFMEIDTDSDKFLKDAIVISDPETEDPAKDAFATTNTKRRNAKHNPSPRSCHGPYGKLNPHSRTSAPNTDLSSMKMLSFDISMAKNSESTEPRRVTGSTGKLQNYYVNGSEEQRCSQTMASKTGKNLIDLAGSESSKAANSRNIKAIIWVLKVLPTTSTWAVTALFDPMLSQPGICIEPVDQ